MATHYKDLDIEVPENVYEPREDSFLLAEALEVLNLRGKRVLDLCTGSGIQALIAAKQAKKVVGVDIRTEAIETARKNAQSNGVRNVEFRRSDLFEKIDSKFDLIIINPPYLLQGSEEEIEDNESWNGGEKGRKIINKFLQDFTKYLKRGGTIMLLQSSISSIRDTTQKLEPEFKTEIIKEEKVPWERLVVVKASER